MFGAIVLAPTTLPGPALDLGFLAECLVFYRRVIVVGNALQLKALLAGAGPANTLHLLQSKALEFWFTETQLGVMSSNEGRRHGFVRFSSPDHTIESDVIPAFAAAAGPDAIGRRADEFGALVRAYRYDQFDDPTLMRAVADSRFVERATSAIISAVAPRYLLTATPRFRPAFVDGGLEVGTNIDFSRLNAEYHQRVSKEHSSLSIAYLLAQIQGAEAALAIAAGESAELAEDPVRTRVHELRLSEIISRGQHSRRNVDAFLEVTVEDARAIREAVNSEKVSFSDIVTLADRAERFKSWLDGRPEPADLIREYYRATVANTWADRLPTRIARWAVFSGIGLGIDVAGGGGLGTVGAGLAASAVDAFLVDRLINGWKPHHFVENDLVPTITTRP